MTAALLDPFTAAGLTVDCTSSSSASRTLMTTAAHNAPGHMRELLPELVAVTPDEREAPRRTIRRDALGKGAGVTRIRSPRDGSCRRHAPRRADRVCGPSGRDRSSCRASENSLHRSASYHVRSPSGPSSIGQYGAEAQVAHATEPEPGL
jgi:hypothetical protein